MEGWPLHRQLISRAGGRYAAIMLGLPLSDLTGGFKCFRASALRRLDPDLVHSRGYAFQIELTYHAARAGLEIAEIPIVFREREHGRSKMSAGDRARGDVARPAPAHGLAQHRAGPQHPADGPMTAHLTSWIADLGLAGIFALMADRRRAARRRRADHAVRRRARRGRDLRPPRRRRWPAAVAAGTLGYLTGSLAGWAIGRAGGRPFIERHGRWLHLGPQRFRRAERWFARYGSAFVLFGRLTPLVRSFVSIPPARLSSRSPATSR